MRVLSFMGFLWFSEVVKSRLCDIIINKTFLSISTEKSKQMSNVKEFGFII